MSEKKKIIRISNIPASLNIFCKDLFRELSSDYEMVALSSPGKDLDEIAEREGSRTIAVPIVATADCAIVLIALIRAAFQNSFVIISHSKNLFYFFVCISKYIHLFILLHSLAILTREL